MIAFDESRFAADLRKHCVERTRKGFASFSGIGESTIANWMDRRTTPSVRLFVVACRAMRTDPKSYFVEERTEKYRCASPNCPGYSWKASDRPHPCREGGLPP